MVLFFFPLVLFVVHFDLNLHMKHVLKRSLLRLHAQTLERKIVLTMMDLL